MYRHLEGIALYASLNFPDWISPMERRTDRAPDRPTDRLADRAPDRPTDRAPDRRPDRPTDLAPNRPSARSHAVPLPLSPSVTAVPASVVPQLEAAGLPRTFRLVEISAAITLPRACEQQMHEDISPSSPNVGGRFVVLGGGPSTRPTDRLLIKQFREKTHREFFGQRRSYGVLLLP